MWCVCACMHTYIHVSTCVCVCVCVHMCAYVCGACMHACMHTRVHVCMPAHTTPLTLNNKPPSLTFTLPGSHPGSPGAQAVPQPVGGAQGQGHPDGRARLPHAAPLPARAARHRPAAEPLSPPQGTPAAQATQGRSRSRSSRSRSRWWCWGLGRVGLGSVRCERLNVFIYYYYYYSGGRDFPV